MVAAAGLRVHAGAFAPDRVRDAPGRAAFAGHRA